MTIQSVCLRLTHGLRGLLLLGIFFSAASLSGEELSGFVALESRFFPDEGLYDKQKRQDYSAVLKLEYFQEWDDGNQNLFFVPYLRGDSVDEKRTHADIRDLYWVTIHETWELYAGIRKIFWGVTESQHLVDIINQTDFVDNPSGEENLGQPMVNLSLVRDWGTLDLFVLAGFRERTFPGEKGRFRLPLEVAVDHPVYEAKEGASRLDFAMRSFQSIGEAELGFSFFSGTNRDPQLKAERTSSGKIMLVPHYEVIQQIGIEAQWIIEAWLLKWESITRQHHAVRYTAYTTGFEYTLSNFKKTGTDWGFILEYLYDDRGKLATTPFEQDVFLGTRLTVNDAQSTEFLLGMIADTDKETRLWSVESSRRWGEDVKITLEGRSSANVAKEDQLFALRKDRYLKLEIARFF